MSNDSTNVSDDSVEVFDLTSPSQVEDEVRDELEEQNKPDLQEEVEKLNNREGFEPGDEGYVPKSGTKDEIVDNLSHTKAREQQTGALAQSESDIRDVKLRQLVTHDQNARFEMDYHDPTLFQSFEETGDFTNIPRVTSTGETNEYGEEVYRILGGNRSVTTFKQFIRKKVSESESDADPGTVAENYEIKVNVREFEGDEKDQRAQEKKELHWDNAAQLEPSPINEAQTYRALHQDLGTQKAVAEHLGIYQSQVSNRLQLLELPELVQKCTHIGATDQNERFSKMTPEQWDDLGIPNDGDRLLAISVGAGKRMIELIRKADVDDAKVRAFLAHKGLMTKARDLNVNEFESELWQRAKDKGIISEDTYLDKFGRSSTSNESSGDDGSDESQPDPDHEHTSVNDEFSLDDDADVDDADDNINWESVDNDERDPKAELRELQKTLQSIDYPVEQLSSDVGEWDLDIEQAREKLDDPVEGKLASEALKVLKFFDILG